MTIFLGELKCVRGKKVYNQSEPKAINNYALTILISLDKSCSINFADPGSISGYTSNMKIEMYLIL